jgi:hypothetical protein
MAPSRPVRVAEALDRLLDPLEPDSPKIEPEATLDDAALRFPSELLWPEIEDRGRLPNALRLFPDRLRWSRRLRYRVLRLTLAAALLIAGFIGLVWLMFAHSG